MNYKQLAVGNYVRFKGDLRYYDEKWIIKALTDNYLTIESQGHTQKTFSCDYKDIAPIYLDDSFLEKNGFTFDKNTRQFNRENLTLTYYVIIGEGTNFFTGQPEGKSYEPQGFLTPKENVVITDWYNSDIVKENTYVIITVSELQNYWKITTGTDLEVVF